MKRLFFTIFLAFTFGTLGAQNYDIRLNLESVDCATNQVCYDVQLRRNGGVNFGLAGQNYRIFYDASLASYISGTSSLPAAYGAFSLVQDMQDVDASSINGPLDFEATLGFLNYAIDLNDIQNGGVFLPVDGTWMTTSNICFNVEESVFNDQNACLQVVFGRVGLTDLYSTAFVEVSRWISANNTTNSLGILYDDLNTSDGESACLNTSCGALTVSVNDKAVFENVVNAAVDVCLSAITSENSTVIFNTSNGTAIAGQDYAAVVNLTVNIPAGQMCTEVLIPIIDDGVYEGSETFNVTLTNPSSNMTINRALGVVTIYDNEGPCNASAPIISGN
jgi:hypothetical protein